jgi:hypothetical protein
VKPLRFEPYLQTCCPRNLEVAEMLTVLLLGLPRELGREELHRIHCWRKCVDMMLRKVSAEKIYQSSSGSSKVEYMLTFGGARCG